jgi:hypothetical protein
MRCIAFSAKQVRAAATPAPRGPDVSARQMLEALETGNGTDCHDLLPRVHQWRVLVLIISKFSFGYIYVFIIVISSSFFLPISYCCCCKVTPM